MIPKKLPSAAAMSITVTNTATSLEDLIDTAYTGGLFDWDGVMSCNALDILPEGADIRIAYDGNVPTSALGMLCKSNKWHALRGMNLANVKLIRVGGADVTCCIQIGQSEPGETTNISG